MENPVSLDVPSDAPNEFMARLAAIVAPPRLPPVRYHGVLAPNSSWWLAGSELLRLVWGGKAEVCAQRAKRSWGRVNLR